MTVFISGQSTVLSGSTADNGNSIRLSYQKTTGSVNDTTPSGGRGTFALSKTITIQETLRSTDSISLSDQAKAVLGTIEKDKVGDDGSSDVHEPYNGLGIGVSRSVATTTGLNPDYATSSVTDYSFHEGNVSGNITVTESFGLATDLPLLTAAGPVYAGTAPTDLSTTTQSASVTISTPDQSALPNPSGTTRKTVDSEALTALTLLRSRDAESPHDTTSSRSITLRLSQTKDTRILGGTET